MFKYTPIDALNRLLRRELGTTPNNQNRFKWTHTKDQFGFFHCGYSDLVSPTGLIVKTSQWDKFCWADIFEPRYTIVLWRYRDRDTWIREHGESAPWPSMGEYEMVDGAMLPVGELPDVKTTQIFIQRMKEHLTKTVRDHKREIMEAMAATEKEKDRIIDDRLADKLFPFQQIPGTKGPTSLATPEFMKFKGVN